MMQCKAGHSVIPAMALTIAWRKSRNHPPSQNQALLTHGDAVDLLVKVQQVVEDLVGLPFPLVQSLG